MKHFIIHIPLEGVVVLLRDYQHQVTLHVNTQPVVQTNLGTSDCENANKTQHDGHHAE